MHMSDMSGENDSIQFNYNVLPFGLSLSVIVVNKAYD